MSGHFLLVQIFRNQVLFEFLKKLFRSNFGGTTKILILLKKPCHFSEKNLKNQEEAQDF
jgi:hypothetical protein